MESVAAPGQTLLPRRSPDPTPRLYGLRTADSDDVLHLGDLGFQGERGLLGSRPTGSSADTPFYRFPERRSCVWVKVRGPAE